MTSSSSRTVRPARPFAIGLLAVCALLAGPALHAQSISPGPAAKRAAIHRLLEERADGMSPLARAAAATLDALGAVHDEAKAAGAGGASGRPQADAASVRSLLLEMQNLRNAYGELRRTLASGPALPKGAFASVEKVLDLGDALSGSGPKGRQVSLTQTVGQIERESAKALLTLRRDPPRPVRVIENAVPAVRRAPVPLGASPAQAPAAPGLVSGSGVGILSGTTVTPDIAALAAQLGHDPLKIYAYVRNNFRFETYFGFLKGAQATLETRAGNDYDLAVLTGALLQASGYSIRYARGTANIPAQAMVDWLGLEDPAAANVILNTAGINAVPVVNGPVIDHYRVDRLWVEVQTAPRPGGVPEWLPLDTAFKRHDLTPGVPGMLATVPFDEAAYLSAARRELTFEFYEEQIRAWLQANMPGTTVDDVPLGMTVVPENLGALPRSLPYHLDSLDALYSSIPGTLTHKATIRVVYQASNELSYPIVLPDTSLQRITVSYAVNPADQSIVDGYGGLANTPPFAVSVIPQLKLDGVTVAQGGLIPYLASVGIQTDFYKPEGDLFDGTSTHTVRAGEWAAIGIDAFQISDTMLQREAKTVVDAAALKAAGGTPDPDDLIGAFLHLAIMQYHFDVRAGDAVTTGLAHYRQVVKVSEGAALANQEIISVGGTPFTTLPGALTVDVPRLDRSSFALDDVNTLGPQLRRITGDNGSAQEHALWEGFLNVPGISTIKSLQLAHVSSIPVFVIDDTDGDPNNNCSVLCPQLNLDATTEANIASDVASGHRVTVPRDPTPLNDWIGVGYITEVPATGSAGYIISGGLASAASGASSGAVPPAAASGGAVTVILPDGTILVIPAGLLGNAQGSGLTGDPVNIANGNFFRDETDFSIAALEEPLAFRRYYNSQSTFSGPLGPGWTHPYSDLLVPQPNNDVIWIDGQGTAYTFTPDVAPGTFVSPPGLRETLLDTGSGFTLTRYDGLVEHFDAGGKLTSRVDRNGNAFTFAYDGSGRLSTVSDPASRSLTLSYNGADHIATVADFTGRTWTYGYDGGGRLAMVTSPSDANTPVMITQYAYDGADRLAAVTEPNGGVRQIHYYANGRVAEVVDPLGHAMSLVYNPFKSETRVTDERGISEIHGFNAAGNPDRIVHPDGAVDAWTWVDNRMTSHTDPLGSTETFEYDAEGNQTRKVDATSRETRFEYYSTFGNIHKIIQPVSREVVFDYDASGNVMQVTDPNNGTRTMINNAQGMPTSVTDPRMVTTTFTYGADGQVATESKPLSFSRIYGHNPRGTLATLTDSNSHVQSQAYDLLDRLVSTTDAETNADRRVYDAAGRLIEHRDPRGLSTHYEYDLNSRLTRQVNPDGSARGFEYDAVGNLTAETDELGRVTRHAYDARNRRIRTQFPDGGVVLRWYDAAGRLVASTDPRGNVTRNEYDAAGRRTRAIDALGHDGTTTYDAAGNPETVTDRRGGITQIQYDPQSHTSQVAGEEGRLETIDYDAAGNELERTRYDISGVGTLPPDPRTLPAAIKHRFMKSYDALGRVDTETDPEGHATHYTYDPAGNVLTVTDPLMHVTTYEYTAANRVSKVIRADTGQTRITYDANGNRTEVITPTGGRYDWTYDSRNRVATQKDPLGIVTRFRYDLVGNLLEKDNADGTWVRMKYDPMNRPLRTDRSDGTWTERSYDAAGNLILATTEKTVLKFTYDALNRMSGETLQLKGTTFTKTVLYQYDEESNLTGVTDPTGRALTYLYDLAGQLTEVDSSTQGAMVQITRDGYGQRGVVTYGNGTSGTLNFDRNGRPTGIDWSASIAQFGYTRDGAGAPTTVTESLGGTPETLTITRDALNRPVASSASVAPGMRSETFGYDLNGNLVNPGTGGTTSFNLANQPVSDGVRTYAYDQRGNQLSSTPSMGDARQTVHDPDNRIVGITLGSSHTTITYDALDRPVEIVRDGVKTRIVHAMQNRLVEYDVAGSPTALYTMSGRLDDVFAVETGGGVYYLHTDAVGSVRVVTNGAGAVVGSRQFSLFGRLQGTIGTPEVAPLGYGARPFYLGGSLVDLRARLYDPSLGSFLSNDPLGVLSTFPNPYAYANNRPLMFVDPLGLSPQGPSLLDRLFGGLRLVGGLGETALGVLGILTPEPLTTVGGVLLTAHGIDQIQAGFRQLWNGEPVRTFTSQGLSAGAELLGADGTTAYYIGEYGDAGIGIVLTLGTAAGLESAEIAGQAIRYGPLNEGPLSPDIAQTFRSGTYTGQTLQEPTTLYRVIGEGGNPAGSFWTATPPSGPVQSIIDLALDPAWGNTATTVITAEVPAGTTIYSGFAAAQGGLVGGGSQIYIPLVNSAWIIH